MRANCLVAQPCHPERSRRMPTEPEAKSEFGWGARREDLHLSPFFNEVLPLSIGRSIPFLRHSVSVGSWAVRSQSVNKISLMTAYCQTALLPTVNNGKKQPVFFLRLSRLRP